MRLFACCVTCVIILSGCFGSSSSSEKTGVIDEGTKVWIDYTITSPDFSGVIVDTTQESVALSSQYPIARKVFGPEAYNVDGGSDLPADVRAGLVGKKVGDTFDVTVIPSDYDKSSYVLNNIATLPGELFDRAGITMRVGDLRMIEDKLGVIREIRGERPNHEFIIDLNPWETYRPLTWSVTIRQIGGKKQPARQ